MTGYRIFRVALLAALIATVVWLYASGAYQSIDADGLRTWLRNAGAWGGALFVVAYAFLQPLGVNGLLFLLSAPMVWSPVDAFWLNWAGTVGAGLTSFTFARFVARDWVQARVPKRLERFDERLHRNGFVTVLLLRLVLYTNPALQYGLGVSRVRTSPFVAGTVLGVVPLTLLFTFLGVRFTTWLSTHPVSTWSWDMFSML